MMAWLRWLKGLRFRFEALAKRIEELEQQNAKLAAKVLDQEGQIADGMTKGLTFAREINESLEKLRAELAKSTELEPKAQSSRRLPPWGVAYRERNRN